jgi:hypothetical protein
MNLKQILIAAAVVALAPIAAQANGASTQRFGEAYPAQSLETPSVLSRDDVREEVQALDRLGQNFGEAYPYDMKDPMTMRQLAEVRREGRNAPRMYGEANGERSHN